MFTAEFRSGDKWISFIEETNLATLKAKLVRVWQGRDYRIALPDGGHLSLDWVDDPTDDDCLIPQWNDSLQPRLF
jgi:hypothetical protein